MNLAVDIDPFNPEVGVRKNWDNQAGVVLFSGHPMSLERQSGLRFS